MVQENMDPFLCEYGLGDTKMDLPNCHKQLPVPVKKTALRVLQNDNIMEPTSIGNSSFSKDKGPATDSNRISGSKRSSSDYPVSHHVRQSTGNNAANGHLVYVRRKPDAEFGKSNACENSSVNAYCTHSRQLCEEVTAQPKPQIEEPKVSCFPAFTPFPMPPSVNSSGKPSLPLSLGKSAIRLAPVESNTPSASPTTGNPKGLKHGQWEERYHLLQMFLRKLDQSDLEEYNQMLRSLSSVELSRHAVELEKRAIQLSLEEARELQRVAVLNVLGKSLKNFKAPADHHECSVSGEDINIRNA